MSAVMQQSLTEFSIVTAVVAVVVCTFGMATAQEFLTGAEENIQESVEISQEKGADSKVDYKSLTKYGPWDDRNYALTLEDISLLPENDQYLANVPVFFKVQLRKEQPELGEHYPRSAFQSFQIQHSGLVVNGLLYKDGSSQEFVAEPAEDESSEGEPCEHNQ